MELRIPIAETFDDASSFEAFFRFAQPSRVSVDTMRPGGVLRSATLPENSRHADSLVTHQCRIRVLGAPGARRPTLDDGGFDTIDLASLAKLQVLLESIRCAGRATDPQIADLRREMQGRSFRLSNGKRLRVLFIVPSVVIVRKSGPNGVAADPEEQLTKRTQGPSVSVHVDQDVRGMPLRRILRGAAPWLFRHESPDGANRRSPLFFVNVWIPLQQVTYPLAMMDDRTLDRRRHQARYMVRSAHGSVDYWAFLHDPSQQWYFTPDMDPTRAYVFNTFSTPHAPFALPGEAETERLYRSLRSARDAVQRRDAPSLAQHAATATCGLPSGAPASLRHAFEHMQALLTEASSAPDVLCSQPDIGDWCDRAARALDRVVRKSIEMRAVALIT